MEPDKEFVHSYGLFLLKWASFTTLIELILTKELGISHMKGHIICQTVSFGNQLNILKSLLYQKSPPDQVGPKMISGIVNYAKRNFLTHGLVNMDNETGNIVFSKRDVRTGFEIAELSFSNDDFKEHVANFLMKQQEIKTYFSISDEEIKNYISNARKPAEHTTNNHLTKRSKQQQVMRSTLSAAQSRNRKETPHQPEPLAQINTPATLPPASMLKKLLGIKS